MPDAADQKHFLLFDQNRFYALSWMIAELGNLKDNGLKMEIIKEALLQTTKTTEKEALAKAYKLAGAGQKTIQQILNEAEKLIKTYCKEKNLEVLIAGIAATK
jgi:methylthioribose-1-phosphate isomerase